MPSPAKVKELQLPLARVKTIMKSCPDADSISPDATYYVAKATELFVAHLAKEALQHSKDNVLDYKDVAEVIQKTDKFDFLWEMIPRKITVKQYKEKIAKKEAEREKDSDSDSSESSSTE